MGETEARVSGLFIYPVKSARGIERDRWEVDELGFHTDRRWMVVGPDGRFVSQREEPRMALVGVELRGERLVVSAPEMDTLTLPREPAEDPARQVRLWGGAEVPATDVGDEAADWFSDYLGAPCRLVHASRESARRVDPRYDAEGRAVTSFTDGYPFLIISREALDELNARLETQLAMNRFRPSLVVEGAGAHAEDGWRRIRIADIDIDVVKPCSRCAVTTVDQATGVKGKEPLRTLATYRGRDGKVMFGMNAIHRSRGTIRVGDPVEVVEAADPVEPRPPAE